MQSRAGAVDSAQPPLFSRKSAYTAGDKLPEFSESPGLWRNGPRDINTEKERERGGRAQGPLAYRKLALDLQLAIKLRGV